MFPFKSDFLVDISGENDQIYDTNIRSILYIDDQDVDLGASQFEHPACSFIDASLMKY